MIICIVKVVVLNNERDLNKRVICIYILRYSFYRKSFDEEKKSRKGGKNKKKLMSNSYFLESIFLSLNF